MVEERRKWPDPHKIRPVWLLISFLYCLLLDVPSSLKPGREVSAINPKAPIFNNSATSSAAHSGRTRADVSKLTYTSEGFLVDHKEAGCRHATRHLVLVVIHVVFCVTCGIILTKISVAIYTRFKRHLAIRYFAQPTTNHHRFLLAAT